MDRDRRVNRGGATQVDADTGVTRRQLDQKTNLQFRNSVAEYAAR